MDDLSLLDKLENKDDKKDKGKRGSEQAAEEVRFMSAGSA